MNYEQGAEDRRQQLRDALEAACNRAPRDIVPPTRTDQELHSGRQRITWIEEIRDDNGNVIGLVEKVEYQYVTAPVMPITDPEFDN